MEFRILGPLEVVEDGRPAARPWREFNFAHHPEGMRGAASRYLGILATRTGPDAWGSGAAFRACAREKRRNGRRPWLAYTQGDYARMLLARQADGDRRADELLVSARDLAGEIGMVLNENAEAERFSPSPPVRRRSPR